MSGEVGLSVLCSWDDEYEEGDVVFDVAGDVE